MARRTHIIARNPFKYLHEGLCAKNGIADTATAHSVRMRMREKVQKEREYILSTTVAEISLDELVGMLDLPSGARGV